MRTSRNWCNTSDEWILQRTGIRERHIADPGVATSDLAKVAAEGAMARGRHHRRRARVHRRRHDDAGHDFPEDRLRAAEQAGRAQRVGLRPRRACSGFTYSLTTAMQMVATGTCDHALAVGADVMSSIIDYTDRDDVRAVRRRRRRGGGLAGRGERSRASSRFRPRDRRQRRAGAVHAGGRQQDAGVGRRP